MNQYCYIKMGINENIFHPALQGTVLKYWDNTTQGASHEDSWVKPYSAELDSRCLSIKNKRSNSFPIICTCTAFLGFHVFFDTNKTGLNYSLQLYGLITALMTNSLDCSHHKNLPNSWLCVSTGPLQENSKRRYCMWNTIMTTTNWKLAMKIHFNPLALFGHFWPKHFLLWI